MLSILLHKHIDQMDLIEQKAQDDIDKIIAAISIKDLIKDPHKAMTDVAEEIRKVMEEIYIPKSVEDGRKLVAVMKEEKIIVDPSKDPTKNESVAS